MGILLPRLHSQDLQHQEDFWWKNDAHLVQAEQAAFLRPAHIVELYQQGPHP